MERPRPAHQEIHPRGRTILSASWLRSWPDIQNIAGLVGVVRLPTDSPMLPRQRQHGRSALGRARTETVRSHRGFCRRDLAAPWPLHSLFAYRDVAPPGNPCKLRSELMISPPPSTVKYNH